MISPSEENDTNVIEFILVGLSRQPASQLLFFWANLFIYSVTLMGNILIIVIIQIDSHLHTPMYFFLSQLSFLDICYSTSSTPMILVNCWKDFPTISYSGCLFQMTISLYLGVMECFLLAIMAYDRFLAISKPLHYPLIMNNNVCIWMVVGVWASAFLMAVIPVLVTPIHFCGHNVVNHFTCELQVLFKLSCSHVLVKEILMFASGVLVLFLPFGFIVLSYFRIAVAVLRIHSVEARLKAFSTCGSHLTVVIIYYGTAMFMYMRPHSQSSQDEDKIISVLYGVVTPMLNPLIYTLRNKDVKDALKKVVKGKKLV